jgi:hypothetical protein
MKGRDQKNLLEYQNDLSRINIQYFLPAHYYVGGLTLGIIKIRSVSDAVHYLQINNALPEGIDTFYACKALSPKIGLIC